MNKIKKLILLILISIFTTILCSEIYAIESNKDGLIIDLTTDKDTYKKGESISLDLSVKNTNDVIVNLIETENIIPQGFTVDENSPTKLESQKLDIGETVHLRTSITMKEKETVLANKNINTSDSTTIKNFAVIATLSALSVFIIIVFKYKSTRKSLMFLLALGLSIASTFTSIKATNISNNNIIEKEIIYDGKKIKVSGRVNYEISYQDPKDPVEYQDGVKETEIDYVLDEENSKIIVSDSVSISSWKKGEVHVLKNKAKPELDIAIKVESIEWLENGSAIITYSTPQLSSVIKSLNYSGTEEQSGVLIPAEGVEFSETSSKSKGRSAIQSRSKGTFDLFKKKTFTYDRDGIQFSGELCVKRLNYDFKVDVGLTGINFEKGYVTLESSVKLGLEVNYSGNKKINLASFEAPIGYGFFAVGDLHCYFSASGELILEYTINATCGFNYENKSFKGIWEFDNKLSKAKADVNLKVGCSVEPKVSFLKIGLIGGEFDFGRNYELKLEDISLSPLEYCIDAGYFNYASVSAVLLPGSSWDKKYTVSLFGENDSPTREMIHIEEENIVDECTRKFGSLEGTVRKQVGENQEPLYLANVLLEKDGKVLYSTQSQSQGKFSFAKEIEKGTYDIFVRSSNCETYKGKVEIKGNKNNKIEEPIVLQPYAESITVTGTIYDSANNLPISNATVSVEGFVDRTTKTDFEGNYILDVPKGSRKIVANAKNYGTNSHSSIFETNVDNINIGLQREYGFEVLTINAGESYQLDFTKSKRIFVRAETDAEYSSFTGSNATYHGKRNSGDEYYTGGNEGAHWEIKVFSGSLAVYASNNDFYEGPDSNLSEYCTYSSLNGIDPFIEYTLKAGDSKTFDNQVDLPKSTSFTMHYISNDIVEATETVTDYYWNTHFGWEIGSNVYDLKGKQNFWRGIGNLVKVKIEVAQGELTVYYYRLDDLKVS